MACGCRISAGHDRTGCNSAEWACVATTLPEPLMLGIFGVRVEPQHVLQAGDRVEIYRALTINPKDIRRKRAAKNPVGRYAKSNRLRQLK